MAPGKTANRASSVQNSHFLGPAIQVEWMDRPEMPLERQVGEILAVLAIAGPLLEESRIKAEEAERRRREEEQRRQQEADRRKTERNRWRRFLEFADRWEEADRARRFIKTIETFPSTDTASHGGLSHEEWLAWVKTRLMACDPLEAAVKQYGIISPLLPRGNTGTELNGQSSWKPSSHHLSEKATGKYAF